MEATAVLKQQFRAAPWWAPGAVLAAVFLWAFWEPITGLVHQWMYNDDYSHGLLILPISAYLVWEKRGALGRAPVESDIRAVGLLIGAALLSIIGELGAELFTIRISMLLFLIGLVWLLYGPAVCRVLTFPLAFLFLMLPLPGFIHRTLMFPLQLFASKWSVHLMHLAGVSAYREGNIIDIGVTQLQVVEACNGLRFILPLFTIGILFAFYRPQAAWKRAVLIASTLPIAVGANVFRIAGTGYIAKYWGSEAAEGFFHSFSGWAVFAVSLVLFLGISAVLSRLPGRTRPASADPAAPSDGGTGRIRPRAFLAGVFILLMIPLSLAYFGSVRAVPIQRPLSEFPARFQGLLGKRTTMDPHMWDQVGGQEYVILDYPDATPHPVNFYVAYYEYQRKAGDFIHSPELCISGAGWFVVNKAIRRLPVDIPEYGHALTFKEMVTRKGDMHQLVYYWYQGRGRNFANEFTAKFYLVWDGIFRRRTDGALVRVITPLEGPDGIHQARQALDRFAISAAEELTRFLP